MLHYLRIAVTALSLTACVLLIALWVRSHWSRHYLAWEITRTQWLELDSQSGATFIQYSDFTGGTYQQKWSVIPHWFLVLLTGTIAAAPWIHRLKRFSLRTLLIATTLVALGLGAVIYLAR